MKWFAENRRFIKKSSLRVRRTLTVCLYGFLAATLFSVSAFAGPSADLIPPSPVPPRLVNDFAGILGEDVPVLERMLCAFNDSTTNQITVVTVNDLGGYSPAEFAYRIGERWGVGNKKYNNGIVILIKPKNRNGAGQVSISVGYGLEGAIPDAVCKRIIENEMIPFFRQEDYRSGLMHALVKIMPLASGEISAKEYMSAEGESELILLGIALFIVILIVFAILINNRNNRNRGDGFGGDDNPEIRKAVGGILWGLGGMASSSSHQGAWGGFSGGFGGFGGGSFGGGGASGSW